MSERTIHPEMDPMTIIDLLNDGVREINGISNLDDVRLIQACIDAVELDVTWRLTRNGQTAVLVDGGAGYAATDTIDPNGPGVQPVGSFGGESARRVRCAYRFPSRRRCSNTATNGDRCDMHQEADQ